MIAGPCSVESSEQVCAIAKAVKKSGATLLRGGAFKPRTSPYSFQGLGKRGLDILLEAKRETGLPIVTELMSIEHLPLFNDIAEVEFTRGEFPRITRIQIYEDAFTADGIYTVN